MRIRVSLPEDQIIPIPYRGRTVNVRAPRGAGIVFDGSPSEPVGIITGPDVMGHHHGWIIAYTYHMSGGSMIPDSTASLQEVENWEDHRSKIIDRVKYAAWVYKGCPC
jgi:hypothetical protein